MNVIRKTVPLPDGREIIIETGKLAKQADGARLRKQTPEQTLCRCR